MTNCYLDKAAKEYGPKTRWQILKNNKYNPSHIYKTSKRIDLQDISDGKDNRDTGRWAKFTYVGKEIKFIAKLFKNLPIRTEFTTNNSIGRLLSQKPNNNSNSTLDNSGVYMLTCPECQMKYVGETGRSFWIRFQEHHRDFKQNNAKSTSGRPNSEFKLSIHGRYTLPMYCICLTVTSRELNSSEP